MSIQAIAAAFKSQTESPSMKFILLCFANYANEYGTTWCSNSTIKAMTGMDEKTITKWVKKLETTGHLTDTGKRQGDTGKIKIYKIVSFETHPKTVVLESVVIPPNSPGLNTPKNGEPPAPPIENNLKSKPKEKYNTKKSLKITLAQWEEKQGSPLRVEMLSSWIKDARANPEVVAMLIIEFREKVSAGGNQYADFVAAFKVWLRNGYLSKKLAEVQMKAQRTITADVERTDRSTSL